MGSLNCDVFFSVLVWPLFVVCVVCWGSLVPTCDLLSQGVGLASICSMCGVLGISCTCYPPPMPRGN
jgi:hypothetical protein